MTKELILGKPYIICPCGEQIPAEAHNATLLTDLEDKPYYQWMCRCCGDLYTQTNITITKLDE